jgi:hypothetical protein
VTATDFLASMAPASAARVAAARALLPDGELLACALASPLPPRLQLSPQRFDLIAEVKLRSRPWAARGRPKTSPRVDYVTRRRPSVLTSRHDSTVHLDHLRLQRRHWPGARPRCARIFWSIRNVMKRAWRAPVVLAILRMVPVEVTGALLDMSARLGLFVLLGLR